MIRGLYIMIEKLRVFLKCSNILSYKQVTILTKWCGIKGKKSSADNEVFEGKTVKTEVGSSVG
jgi:hypothetical protein